MPSDIRKPIANLPGGIKTIWHVEFFEGRGKDRYLSLRCLKTFQIGGVERDTSSYHGNQKAWDTSHLPRTWAGCSSNARPLVYEQEKLLCSLHKAAETLYDITW